MWWFWEFRRVLGKWKKLDVKRGFGKRWQLEIRKKEAHGIHASMDAIGGESNFTRKLVGKEVKPTVTDVGQYVISSKYWSFLSTIIIHRGFYSNCSTFGQIYGKLGVHLWCLVKLSSLHFIVKLANLVLDYLEFYLFELDLDHIKQDDSWPFLWLPWEQRNADLNMILCWNPQIS